LEGNVEDLNGSYQLTGNADGTRLRYQANIVPGFWLPPLIGPAIMRSEIRDQLQGVIDEVARRKKR
ncbi:MAG: hypothetical protein ACREUA_08205, partial [Burkholderiales bacterium]